MWVKVVQKFKDKHTGEIHKVGDKLNLKKERIEEILSKGEYITEINRAENP